MAYTERNFRTKKALKEALKGEQRIKCYQPGSFDLKMPGVIYLKGPHYPQPHTWYAQVVVDKDGFIIKFLK